jgi:hypothetical protein
MPKTAPAAIVVAGAVIALAIVLGAFIQRPHYAAWATSELFGRLDVQTGRMETCQPETNTRDVVGGNTVFGLICTDDLGHRSPPR